MNIARLFHTVRHLQARQVWYRCWYPVKKRLYRPGNIPGTALEAAAVFPRTGFYNLPVVPCFQPAENSFEFLNIGHRFGQHIDWDFPGHGRLWTYNLNYFAWLQDETLSVNDRLHTIYQYIDANPATGTEPYPSSLRNISWIRFLSREGISDEKINTFLYRSYHRLAAFPEYHIAANHLLENAFSLLYGACFFNRKEWFSLAKRLLTRGLHEQVLPDGGHYERSPMYHCLLLERLLMCIELLQGSGRSAAQQLQTLMQQQCGKMLGWLQAFMFSDGSFAMVQDAAPGIAPAPEALFRYAGTLKISTQSVSLKESGYRHIKGRNWELLLNLGAPSPAYQPGHAHADALSFCLQVNGKPLITDTGVSGYEPGSQRLWEKSTDAHNTVEIARKNSSDVWSNFRVGSRASVFITAETPQSVTAYHDGYRHMDVIHRRTFRWTHEKIIIEDEIKNTKGCKALLHLHFHPDVVLLQTGPNWFTANGVMLGTGNDTGAQLLEYQFCAGFNKRIKAQRLRLYAADRVAVVIEF